MASPSDEAAAGGAQASRPAGVDRAVRLTVPRADAEVVGAILMDLLGSFEVQDAGATADAASWPDAQPAATPPESVALVFYPAAAVAPDEAEVLAALPEELRESGRVTVATSDVPRDWTEGWKDHFQPVVVGEVRIRPPWEAPADPDGPLADVVINPGLGFGTGSHATTRGALLLLQEPDAEEGGQPVFRGPVVDVGTGSGVLSIAAAKLGWGPIFAFDNDPVALVSARENVVANDVAGVVEIHQTDVEGASSFWFSGATVLANMTLDPVLALMRKLSRQRDDWGDVAAARPPERVVVAGILAGAQEQQLLGAARLGGLSVARRVYEDEWVSMELLPSKPAKPTDSLWG